MGKPLWQSKIVVEAAANVVADLLLNVKPGKVGKDNAFMLYAGDNTDMTLTGGPEVFRAHVGNQNPNGGGMRVEVDRKRRLFAVQGGWWYRGEHTVEDHPKGALLVYRILNVAKVRRWMVPLVWRSFQKSMGAPKDQAKRVGERLGVKAYEA
ncbi:hypothetical protein [Lentzea sp. NBRC 105346]|uniref:hypothetical protein n=1 Tax=Lentzea sp. NBRC 105346 TaxID=3032205 RepID=UPI0025530900|nr:hypothetical protein [Lentzea sp. NBRC 105346]